MRLLADLHNHSCLSPCASLEMSPALLARRARARGIGLLALTDHNAALNAPAFAEACAREGLAPLFGLEACSIEEVHVLCLFGTADEALSFGEELYALLPALAWEPGRFGDQVVVDADENVLDMPERWYGAALELGFDGLCALAVSRGALVIPAHVDRPMMSVSSQLGFLPPGPYAAVEAMREPDPSLTGGLAVVSGSDAHAPEHVGRRPFEVELGGAGGQDAVDVSAPPRGAELLAALGEALRAGRVRPSWALGATPRSASGA